MHQLYIHNSMSRAGDTMYDTFAQAHCVYLVKPLLAELKIDHIIDDLSKTGVRFWATSLVGAITLRDSVTMDIAVQTIENALTNSISFETMTTPAHEAIDTILERGNMETFSTTWTDADASKIREYFYGYPPMCTTPIECEDARSTTEYSSLPNTMVGILLFMFARSDNYYNIIHALISCLRNARGNPVSFLEPLTHVPAILWATAWTRSTSDGRISRLIVDALHDAVVCKHINANAWTTEVAPPFSLLSWLCHPFYGPAMFSDCVTNVVKDIDFTHLVLANASDERRSAVVQRAIQCVAIHSVSPINANRLNKILSNIVVHLGAHIYDDAAAHRVRAVFNCVLSTCSMRDHCMVIEVMNAVGPSLFYSTFTDTIARYVFGECELDTVECVYTAIEPFMADQQHTLITSLSAEEPSDSDPPMSLLENALQHNKPDVCMYLLQLAMDQDMSATRSKFPRWRTVASSGNCKLLDSFTATKRA